ncbi:MAG: hypothetical protein ACP5NV_01860 [Candidatus Woesearchaeota archaeon]
MFMLQNIPKEKILEVVRQGPTVPSRIVKIVGGDTMLIGAILSTMISTGEVKYSTLKIGGSPVYYIPDQEPRLEEFVKYLNDKDQKTVMLLKDQKILKDSTQDPLTKVSLKTIKDFAKTFEIEQSGKKELFYRYFLVSREDAVSIAISSLKIQEQTPPTVSVDDKNSSSDKSATTRDEVLEEPTTMRQDIVSEKIAVEHKVSHTRDVKSDSKSDFFELIKAYIHEKNLDIIGKEKIKKSEYNLILKNHDKNDYIYCVAKDKKTINEGDLSTAFVFAHQKKMPCIFLMTGHLTKKAENMSEKEFKDMTIEKI